ncbi:MAG: DUF3488 and transglutaminase-like domain-containing protein [Candidatus Hydrogenedentes bacterium]|nr:DUF3488 and transglutaminase-like domain-containing protein [Candidatus Hydrogenedentota bacterium]
MPKGVMSTLRLSTTAMVFSGYFALLTTRDYSPLVLFWPTMFMLLMPWCERADARSPAYRRFTWTVTLLFAVAGIPALPFVLGGVLPGLVGLFVFIQGYLLLHMKKSRDYHYLILMSFFFLVSGCHLDPEPSYGLVLSLFVISAVWTFVSLLIYSESHENEGRPWAEIVETGTRENYVPSPLPRLFDRNLIATMSLLSVGAVMMTIGIFLLTPRMEAGGLGGRTQGLTTTTGLSNTVDVSQSGRILENQAPVMQVTFPDEPNGQLQGAGRDGKLGIVPVSRMYWRVTTLTRFDGSRWERFPTTEEKYNDKPGRFYFFPGTDDSVDRTGLPHRRTVRQEIFLDDQEANGLPALPLVRSVRIKNGRIQWDANGDFTVAPTRRSQQALSYEAISEVESFGADELRAAPGNYEEVLGYDYGTLTQYRLSEQSVALARQVTANAQTAYDKVRAIEEFLSSDTFFYTLDVPDLGATAPIDEFLNAQRAGHCQLFATAMAMMVRSLGIPSRVVSGYRGGEWSEGDSAYIVRKSMAHLWVEVYFVGIGWVTFDPAPQTDEDPTVVEQIGLAITHQILNIKLLWYRDIVGFEGGFQMGDLQLLAIRIANFDFSFLNPSALLSPMVGSTLGRGVLWLVAIIAGTWFMVFAFTLKRTPRGFRGALTADQSRAAQLFARLKRHLRSQGMDCRGMSAREILELAAAGEPGIDTHSLNTLLDEYNKVRFGGRGMSKVQFVELKALIRRLRRPKPAR